MYVLMDEQMRSMNEQVRILQVTNEGMQRIVEHVVRVMQMMANVTKQSSQSVEKMEQGVKVLMEEVRARQKEMEATKTKEHKPREKAEDEQVSSKVNEVHKLNETCCKGKGNGNGGKREYVSKGGEFGGKEAARIIKGDDEEDERVQVAHNMEEAGGTRRNTKAEMGGL